LEIVSTGATRQPGTKIERRREPVYNAFESVFLFLQGDDAPAKWRGEDLPTPVPENIAREIVWDLFEINFRFELFALDSRASTVSRTNEDRVDLVDQCFATKTSLFTDRTPQGNCGLVDDDWRERHHYLLAMFRLMATWEGKQPPIFRKLSEENEGTDLRKEQMKELEESIAQFYTQSFFDYFGRAALIPHCVAQPSYH
jgi:hypothetical protein